MNDTNERSCASRVSAVSPAHHLKEKVDRMQAALERIERWFGEFPETGQFWDDDKRRPMSYGACYGSNGERDFMRQIAREALQQNTENQRRPYVASSGSHGDQCRCGLATRLVGDGCEHCNPTMMIDILRKQIADMRLALADAIRRPMGVIPESADGLLTQDDLDAAEKRRTK
jgi:hypothetical protein